MNTVSKYKEKDSISVSCKVTFIIDRSLGCHGKGSQYRLFLKIEEFTRL